MASNGDADVAKKRVCVGECLKGKTYAREELAVASKATEVNICSPEAFLFLRQKSFRVIVLILSLVRLI
jgi:hypothetical protein